MVIPFIVIGGLLTISGPFFYRYSAYVGKVMQFLSRRLNGPRYPEVGPDDLKVIGVGALIIGPVMLAVSIAHLIIHG